MFTAKCDKCGKEASFEPLYRREGDLELIFLKCPECEAEYLASVTDPDLRRGIEEFARMAKVIRTESVTDMFIEDAQKLYRENIARGKALKEQYLNQNEK